MDMFNGQSDPKMIIAVGLYVLMKVAISCFAMPPIDGHKIQVLKSSEFPRNNQKSTVWESVSTEGFIDYHFFKIIMDGSYYVQILQDDLIPNARRQFDRRWRLQQDNDSKHKS